MVRSYQAKFLKMELFYIIYLTDFTNKLKQMDEDSQQNELDLAILLQHNILNYVYF